MRPSHLPCCQVQLYNQSKQNLVVKTDFKKTWNMFTITLLANLHIVTRVKLLFYKACLPFTQRW